MDYLILFFSGIVGGLIAGVLGLGGGIFYILILPFVMQWQGIPAQDASPFVVANSLIGIAFASGVSLISQYSNLRKYIKESLYIGIAAVMVSLLATKYVVHSVWFSKELFNILVIGLMILILFQMLIKNRVKDSSFEKNLPIAPLQGIFSGVGAGLVSAVSGLGGGIIIIPLLQLRFHQTMQKAKLISLAIIFLSSTFISIQNILSTPLYHPTTISSIGFILPNIAIPMILGVIIGGPMGVKLSAKLSERMINYLFISFVFIVMLEKLFSLIFNA